MTKAEKTAIATAHMLLQWATSCDISNKSDFSKGMIAGYRAAAEELLFRIRMNDFSE